MAGLLLKELKARGLVRRTLIVAPANLTFQWQRELKDKFRESFEVIRGETLRTNYGHNPWQDRDQVITSISWVSRVEDAKESLLRSHWDLIVVDEAHKMSAYADDRKTLAYRLGESLSSMTDHYLLMTATPHKGDAENFCRFLALLDKDVYGNVKSLEDAMRRGSAPFYLRRTKEALVTFPDPDTGEVKKLFTKREVKTTTFELNAEEFDFYDALTRYVEDQSIRASADDSAAGRAVGFIMAMLQRRMASSVYAVRRSLERMKAKREEILADPEAYRRQRIERRIPDDFDELTDDEQADLLSKLENEVISIDPAVLREEIARLSALIAQARGLEARGVGTKLAELRRVLTEIGAFADPKAEAAALHRAQGHARLPRGRRQGRPAPRQAPRVGAVGHPDPRRDEDRRPRHARHPHLRRARVQGAGPGAGGDRGGRRGDQPPVLPHARERRHPLEPGAAGAADGPHPPLRPGARLPDLQLRRGEHQRRAGAGQAAGTPARNPQGAGHRPGLRRGRRGLPRQPAGAAVPRPLHPPHQRPGHRGPHRPRREPRSGSGRSPNRPWRGWRRRS